MNKLLGICAVVACAALAPPVHAAGNLDCELRYDMAGWSAFYKTASGTGTIRCDNGASIPVRIEAKGGGLTVGKTSIRDGRGQFSGAYSVDGLLGTYVAAEAHAGAAKASTAQVMTKGDISLALAGTGEGWSLGVGFGKFVLSRR
jgi:hypothetical protein